jgi:preprotein translocase subunit SecE
MECCVSDLSVLVVLVALVALTAGFLAVLDGVLTKGGRR